MSAVAERLNFSIVQGAAFPLRGVSTGGIAAAVAVIDNTAALCPASRLMEGGGLNLSKLGIETVPACIALARFCSSGPVIRNLSSARGFFMSDAACAFADAVAFTTNAGVEG